MHRREGSFHNRRPAVLQKLGIPQNNPGLYDSGRRSVDYSFHTSRSSRVPDFTKRNGTGGESIYGASPFADEDLSRPLDAPGLLCMANKGPNTNSSQFFVTLRECPHLNGKHVVFGKVIRGYDEVVAKLGAVPVDEKSRPLSTVLISNCGELELRKGTCYYSVEILKELSCCT